MPSGPLRLLVVASWYPSIVDPVAGRFVADQVAAAEGTGGATAAVVSFDPADLLGAGGLRSRNAALVRALAGRAVRERPGVFGGTTGTPRFGVARLPVPSGRDPAIGPLHAAEARVSALDALADRWLAGREAAVPLPDVIHAHTVYPDGVAAAHLARRLARPLIVTEHASFVDRLLAEPAIRDRYVDTVRQAACLIVVSRVLAGELVAALPELEERVVVVPNVVDVDGFRPGDPGGRRPEELLFVGYRKPTKGIDTAIEAMVHVRARRPSATLRLIGASPTDAVEARWRRLIAERGLDGAVTLEPPTDRAGVAAAMRRAGLFVHPSPRETFGVVAAEALAAGLPVVAADSGGVTEIVGEGAGPLGAVVPAGDPDRLAAAIIDTLDRAATFDPARLRAAVAERFGADVVGRRLVELYGAAVEGGAGSAEASAPSAPSVGPPGRGPGAAGQARVVVAFDPARLEALRGLTAAARAGVVVATSREAPAAQLAGLAGAALGDLAGRIRGVADARAIGAPRGRLLRLLAAIRHPIAVARRRGWLPGLEHVVETRGSATIREAVRLAQARAAGPVELVCVDGLDYLAAAPLVEAGEAVLAPGGLRWLGDQLDGDAVRSALGWRSRGDGDSGGAGAGGDGDAGGADDLPLPGN
jgi:glycogen(starch) synthase